jgi:hypothetical protein
MGMGTKEDESSIGCVWAAGIHHSPFSLGAHFETYEQFISLIFQFFSRHSKPQITEPVDMEAQLYL